MPVGIDTLTATPQTIELGGRPLRLTPLTATDLGHLQAWIHAQLPDPIAVAQRLAAGMPESVQEKILNRAFDQVMSARKTHMIGTDEADEYIASVQGFTQILALMCKAYHPEMTADVLAPLVSGLGKDQINAISWHAFGITPRRSEVTGVAPGANGDANAGAGGAGDPKAAGGPDGVAAPAPSIISDSSPTSPAATAGLPTSSPA